MWNNLSIYWRAQIIGWALLALVSIIERKLLYQSLERAVIITCFLTPVMIILTEILRTIYIRTALSRGINLISTCIITVCSISAGLFTTLTAFCIFQINNWSIPGWTTLERIAIPFVQNALLFSGWSLTYFWISAEIGKKYQSERVAKAEAEKLKVELQKLRLQLNPHFLFNALNGVMEEIPENSAEALSMLRNLTAYLRYSLNSIDETVVDVKAEVEAINSYLAIQETRFGPRLRCHVAVTPDASTRPIVSFLLQPLVENAIKHGNRNDVMDLNIDIATSGSALKIEIRNTGTLEREYAHPRNYTPIGLINLSQRLALHYPDRHQFSLHQIENDIVAASLILENDPCSGS
jgi:hypothetical protein